ncbi:hypothetical protein ACVRZR_00475 [Streptococcus entericus]|uniref:hypothetical protein n=1 Tax=Streptococcus entericus TaxID=155680 RepID=UPI00035FC2D2|nr:hypothetical protein [Streptococcus entericus]
MKINVILGLVFLMFAFILGIVVKPWYLGVPFLLSGLYYMITSVTTEKDKEDNHDI